jgi:hypothetical protein
MRKLEVIYARIFDGISCKNYLEKFAYWSCKNFLKTSNFITNIPYLHHWNDNINSIVMGILGMECNSDHISSGAGF